jgi:hypothetical protein
VFLSSMTIASTLNCFSYILHLNMLYCEKVDCAMENAYSMVSPLRLQCFMVSTSLRRACMQEYNSYSKTGDFMCCRYAKI